MGEGGGEPEEGEGGRGELWRRLRPAVCLSSPEEDEAEDWVHLTQFAGGGKLRGAGGPLVFPVPAAGRPEPADRNEDANIGIMMKICSLPVLSLSSIMKDGQPS